MARVILLIVTIACGVGALLCAVASGVHVIAGIDCIGAFKIPSTGSLACLGWSFAGLAWASTLAQIVIGGR